MRAHIDDVLTAELAIIEFSGFDREPVFFDASGRRQNMCMMIALVAMYRPIGICSGYAANLNVSAGVFMASA